MLDSFGCVSCFLLGVILCQDVDEAHKIYLLLGGPCRGESGEGKRESERRREKREIRA